MKLRAMLGVAVCAGSLGLSAPALADIVDVTYTGTVSGTDFAGVFGTMETNLTGQTFTATYKFDTGAGTSFSSASQNFVQGGIAQGNTSPNLSASFTIGSTTISFVGDQYGFLFGYNDGSSFSQVEADAYSSDGTSMTIGAYIGGPDFPASITDPVTVDLSSGDALRYGSFVYTPDNIYFDNFRLNATQMTISSPVPEPESYAMMLAGLGLLGFAARRRKQKAAAAA